jgi:hypothetical protein
MNFGKEGALGLETGMATDLQTRNTSSKSEANLRRAFAELCARIKRVDLVAYLLALLLTILCYAFFLGLFDWFVGHSSGSAIQAARWLSWIMFLSLLGFLLVRTGQCWLRRVNPYYVAQQIEQTLPDAKNVLINWLDLRDEEMPTAFQRNLSTRAAEQVQEAWPEQTVKTRKNWIMLGALGLPTIGLLILLVADPAALWSSLLRGFMPFYTPQRIARTQITIVQPDGGEAEISPTEAITFAAKIDGRVPAGNRPDSPRLSYRYHGDEDYRSQLLQQGDAGLWTTQLQADQLRTGFWYKISAGDAQTPEHQVRVRARAHVKKFEISYRHPPYRRLPNTTSVFPNERETRPTIRGPRGSEVGLIIRGSRPVRKMSVEMMTGNQKQEVPTLKLADGAFSCSWTLDKPGQFRVTFISTDGEENTDRDWYFIEVPADDAPSVVLTQPGQDVNLPEDATLELVGEASSIVGIKVLTLHLRVIEGPNKDMKLAPLVFRPEKSFESDGGYPRLLEYMEVVSLNQLKDEKGTIQNLEPNTTVLEYWLEGADCTTSPNPGGNIGKSSTYKLTFTPAPKSPSVAKQHAANRQKAIERKKSFEQRQDERLSKENQNRSQQPKGGAGEQNPQQQFDDANKGKQDTEGKIKQALKNQDDQKQRGDAKSPEQNSSTAKDGPPNSPDEPGPQQKDSPSTPPEDSGNVKDKGDSGGSSGEPRDGGATDTKAKDKPGEGQTQASTKGIEQNGPDAQNKNMQAAMNPETPPEAASKASATNDAAGTNKGEPNARPRDQTNEPGKARGDDAKTKNKEPSWDDIAKLIEQLPNLDAEGKEAGKALAEIAKTSDDPRKRDIAEKALAKNGRKPKTGEEKKGPNPFGSGGESAGIADAVKTAAANREFARRIGQMQLEDWKKRVTPELLKKAGLSEAEWQRYLKNMQSYDALVRRLNSKLVNDALKKELRGGANPSTGVREVESGASNELNESGRAPAPPDLRDAQSRHSKRPMNP